MNMWEYIIIGLIVVLIVCIAVGALRTKQYRQDNYKEVSSNTVRQISVSDNNYTVGTFEYSGRTFLIVQPTGMYRSPVVIELR